MHAASRDGRHRVVRDSGLSIAQPALVQEKELGVRGQEIEGEVWFECFCC